MADPFDTDPTYCEKLVAKALLGDDGAARELVGLLAPIIRRVAIRMAPRDIREDLIQEVWAHIWKSNCRVLQKWDRSGPLVSYVAVVASNRMRDLLAERCTRTNPIEDAGDPADPDEDPERAVEVRQLAECLEEAKARLSETYRKMIHMRHDLAMRHQEIADNLGKTVGYVGGTLARAERYLRDEVMETCADHLGRFRSIF